MSSFNSVAGDETTGSYVPADVGPDDWPRLDPALLSALSAVPGLVPTASDVLDELGLPLVVGAGVLPPRVPGGRIVAQATTLRYLPARERSETPRLSHNAVGLQDHVLVIEAPVDASCFGGMAALEARRRGVAGAIVDGAIRDVDEILELGLPVWSRSITPRTGKFRIETVAINGPVSCGGVHVIPGDLVLADATGVCFVPVGVAPAAVTRILEVAGREARLLGR